MVSQLRLFFCVAQQAQDGSQLPEALNTNRKIELNRRIFISAVVLTSVITVALGAMGLLGLLQAHGVVRLSHSCQWLNAPGAHYAMLGSAVITALLATRGGYLLHQLKMQKAHFETLIEGKTIDYLGMDSKQTPLDQIFMPCNQDHPLQKGKKMFSPQFFQEKMVGNSYTAFSPSKNPRLKACMIRRQDGSLSLSPCMSDEQWQTVEGRMTEEQPHCSKIVFPSEEYTNWKASKSST